MPRTARLPGSPVGTHPPGWSASRVLLRVEQAAGPRRQDRMSHDAEHHRGADGRVAASPPSFTCQRVTAASVPQVGLGSGCPVCVLVPRCGRSDAQPGPWRRGHAS
jgi:hypothetical protein